ncbi:MAG: hypothetical protein AB1798_09745, partial [Spirochaetota bacterium]
KDLWRRISHDHYIDQNHVPHIRHEINLLYVAITRARNTLIIYDGIAPSPIWDIDSLNSLVFRTGDNELLKEAWKKLSTPEEWLEQGDYFFKRRYFTAALECYKNSGDLKLSEIAEAFALSESGKYKFAAKLFEKHGYIEKAAENFERDGVYSEALRLWEKTDKINRILMCRIKFYEDSGDYAKAAEEWIKQKKPEMAVKNWEKAGNHKKLGEYYEKIKKFNKAGEYYEKAGNNIPAAKCYHKGKNIKKAADIYFKHGDYNSAAPLYKKLKDTERLLSCHIKLKDFYNAALLYEKSLEWQNAIHYFKQFAEKDNTNKDLLLSEAEKFNSGRAQFKSALRFSAVGNHETAGNIFFKLKMFEAALDEYTQIQSYSKRAECFSRMHDYLNAALEYEKTDIKNKWDLAEDCLTKYVYEKSGYNQSRANTLFQSAEASFNSGNYDKALVRYKAINFPKGIYETYLKLDRQDEAINEFIDFNMKEFIINFINIKKNLTLSFETLRNLFNYFSELRYEHNEKHLSLLLQVWKNQLDRQNDERMLTLIDTILPYRWRYNYKELPQFIFELFVEVKDYNKVFSILKSHLFYTSRTTKKLTGFLDIINSNAQKYNDKNLLACYYFITDTVKYSEILKELEITYRNYELFIPDRNNYLKAVDFLLNENHMERAIHVCKLNNDFTRAALMYEENGDVIKAAKEYLNAGQYDFSQYENALRCYGTKNNKAGTARTLEKMNELDKALEIWKSLGRLNDANRVMKKKLQILSEKKQPGLF